MPQTRKTTLVRYDAMPITNDETVNPGCPSRFVQHETIDVVKLDVPDTRSYAEFTAGWVNRRENCRAITL